MERYYNAYTKLLGAEKRGVVKNKVDTLLRLLGQRFGTLPPQALAHKEKASLQDLERIELRVLTAPTLEEALGLTSNATRGGTFGDPAPLQHNLARGCIDRMRQS